MAYSSQNSPSSQIPERPLSPDDALPPVVPPSPGFILQLFVVPGVIVTIIVLVWLLFNWLAQMGNDPNAYIDAIKRDNEARWQAAVNLANALNNEKGAGFKELRRNSEKVKELAQVLDDELTSSKKITVETSITFRMFLCRALGAFEVADGLPVLLKAANTNRDPQETVVRRSALEAIALLADNVRTANPEHPLDGAELETTLLAAAGDADPVVRSTAAYTMGVVGGESLLEKLRFMTSDGYADVRYNAATGLARHGDPAAVSVLIEMIDPEENAGVEIEQDEQSRDFKRALIQYNGLRAIGTLLSNNPRVDGNQFVPMIKKLLERKSPKSVSIEATDLLHVIERSATSHLQPEKNP